MILSSKPSSLGKRTSLKIGIQFYGLWLSTTIFLEIGYHYPVTLPISDIYQPFSKYQSFGQNMVRVKTRSCTCWKLTVDPKLQTFVKKDQEKALYTKFKPFIQPTERVTTICKINSLHIFMTMIGFRKTIGNIKILGTRIFFLFPKNKQQNLAPIRRK